MAPIAPFSIRLLSGNVDGKTGHTADFAADLPASQRQGRDKDNIVVPTPDDVNCLGRELFVDKINAIQDWLWVCGRPTPPRPLHHQLVIQRDIILTENPELHLVWSKSRMFLKPMPGWLLDPDFWPKFILEDPRNPDPERKKLTACARGFLFSYTALISHESDFRIAK